MLLPAGGAALAGTVALLGRLVRGPVLRRWNSVVPLVVTALATALDVPVLVVTGLLLVVDQSRAAFPVPVAAGGLGLLLVLAAYPFWAARLVRAAVVEPVTQGRP